VDWQRLGNSVLLSPRKFPLSGMLLRDPPFYHAFSSQQMVFRRGSVLRVVTAGQKARDFGSQLRPLTQFRTLKGDAMADEKIHGAEAVIDSVPELAAEVV